MTFEGASAPELDVEAWAAPARGDMRKRARYRGIPPPDLSNVPVVLIVFMALCIQLVGSVIVIVLSALYNDTENPAAMAAITLAAWSGVMALLGLAVVVIRFFVALRGSMHMSLMHVIADVWPQRW